MINYRLKGLSKKISETLEITDSWNKRKEIGYIAEKHVLKFIGIVFVKGQQVYDISTM
jgi:hypothetical protein